MFNSIPDPGSTNSSLIAPQYYQPSVKHPPLSRIVDVPPCTADLLLQTRGKAFFLLYVEGGGAYTIEVALGVLF
jgi:hypothetical protein